MRVSHIAYRRHKAERHMIPNCRLFNSKSFAKCQSHQTSIYELHKMNNIEKGKKQLFHTPCTDIIPYYLFLSLI